MARYLVQETRKEWHTLTTVIEAASEEEAADKAGAGEHCEFWEPLRDQDGEYADCSYEGIDVVELIEDEHTPDAISFGAGPTRCKLCGQPCYWSGVSPAPGESTVSAPWLHGTDPRAAVTAGR